MPPETSLPMLEHHHTTLPHYNSMIHLNASDTNTTDTQSYTDIHIYTTYESIKQELRHTLPQTTSYITHTTNTYTHIRIINKLNQITTAQIIYFQQYFQTTTSPTHHDIHYLSSFSTRTRDLHQITLPKQREQPHCLPPL